MSTTSVSGQKQTLTNIGRVKYNGHNQPYEIVLSNGRVIRDREFIKELYYDRFYNKRGNKGDP